MKTKLLFLVVAMGFTTLAYSQTNRAPEPNKNCKKTGVPNGTNTFSMNVGIFGFSITRINCIKDITECCIEGAGAAAEVNFDGDFPGLTGQFVRLRVVGTDSLIEGQLTSWEEIDHGNSTEHVIQTKNVIRN